MSLHSQRAIREAAYRSAYAADTPLLLAISGGLDSMTLLHVMVSVARERIAAVATFDHGSGEFASAAAAHVVDEARRLGLEAISGRLADGATRAGSLEAMWRAERYRFLRRAAGKLGARVTTAHTRDDQIETVLMREMRGSGARGLAGLAANSDVVRPFLDVQRSELESYASAQGVTWLEDPSNTSSRFFRNRVRADLLPALRRVDPGIDQSLLAIAGRAAAWRAELDAIVERIASRGTRRATTVVVAQSELAGYGHDSLRIVWGALAARAGLALDRRGTHRCATFTMQGPRGGSIPLSGGWILEARRGELVLHRQSDVAQLLPLPRRGALEWGRFRFSADRHPAADGTWNAMLPAGREAIVRGWLPGDRLAASAGQGARRVKRYLSDAGVVGSDRVNWPVVVVNDEVVWIPGVRRSDAATVRSGGPARHYVCERTLD